MSRFVYGPNASLMVSGFESIMDKFNSNLAGKLLVCVDETAHGDKKQFIHDFNIFKSHITANTIEIEQKGKDKYTVPNICNYSFTSNHDGIKVEKDDRRYFCIESSSEYVGNIEYFDKLGSCFTQECGDLLYSYLREEFELVPLSPPPLTEYKIELINNSIPKHEDFLDEVFTSMNIIFSENFFGWDKKVQKWYFSRKELYKIFISWCGNNKSSMKDKKFCSMIIKMDGITCADRKIIDDRQQYCSYLDPKFYSTVLTRDRYNQVINLLDKVKY